MGLFFPQEEIRPGTRPVGFARYRQILERDWKNLMLVGFITLLYYIPFGLGMVYAILSKSALVMLASGVVGGVILGPGLACMYDLILRRFRDDRADWWVLYKKSMRQNLRASILPGVVQCLFLGSVVFCLALIRWAAAPISWGTVALLLFASLAVEMLLTVWWPQVVIFETRPTIQLKNSVLFILMKFKRSFCAALLQVLWWLAAFLFLPWSAFLVPVLGVWYVLMLAMFIIYRPLDAAMHIEEQIAAQFPGQIDSGGE